MVIADEATDRADQAVDATRDLTVLDMAVVISTLAVITVDRAGESRAHTTSASAVPFARNGSSPVLEVCLSSLLDFECERLPTF